MESIFNGKYNKIIKIIMKTSFAVAVLLGLISYQPTEAHSIHKMHHAHTPRSHQLVQSREIDEGDLVEEEADERDADEREDAAESESERQEQLIRQMNKQSKRVNLSQKHTRHQEEDDEPDEYADQGEVSHAQQERNQDEEDDQFVQESEIISEEEDESADERDEGYVEEDDNEEDEFMEQEEDDEENVQVSDDDDDDAPQQAAPVDKAPEHTYFFAGDTNMTPEGKEYTRKYPDEFNEDSPNKFMHHILKEYALEQKDDKGAPSGSFLMNKKWTQVAAREVLEKHKKLNGEALDKYMNQYFGRTWEHFDVNESNVLDALDMPAFMKYLSSDQGLDLDNL